MGRCAGSGRASWCGILAGPPGRRNALPAPEPGCAAGARTRWPANTLHAGWRKRVGVEPTRHVVRVSPDLKSERPTGVRSSSSVVCIRCLSRLRCPPCRRHPRRAGAASATPRRSVKPLRSKNSSSSMAKLRPIPARFLYLAAVERPSGRPSARDYSACAASALTALSGTNRMWVTATTSPALVARLSSTPSAVSSIFSCSAAWRKLGGLPFAGSSTLATRGAGDDNIADDGIVPRSATWASMWRCWRASSCHRRAVGVFQVFCRCLISKDAVGDRPRARPKCFVSDSGECGCSARYCAGVENSLVAFDSHACAGSREGMPDRTPLPVSTGALPGGSLAGRVDGCAISSVDSMQRERALACLVPVTCRSARGSSRVQGGCRARRSACRGTGECAGRGVPVLGDDSKRIHRRRRRLS